MMRTSRKCRKGITFLKTYAALLQRKGNQGIGRRNMSRIRRRRCRKQITFLKTYTGEKKKKKETKG